VRVESRPVLVAIAGPNGAGKTTFYESHLREVGLPFINADRLAADAQVDAMTAAGLAGDLREAYLEAGESFCFETVFSDPVGDKIGFLKRAVEQGYDVRLYFIGVSSPSLSGERVAMRVLQGGHDVPQEKIEGRFPRTLKNLAEAIRVLPRVLVYDNTDEENPHRFVAEFRDGTLRVSGEGALPQWAAGIMQP